VIIAIGLDETLLRREFDQLSEAAVYHCPYCMGWRDEVPIYVARSPRRPLAEIWPEMKRFGLPTRKVLMLGDNGASPD
jgi:hypothetical protein